MLQDSGSFFNKASALIRSCRQNAGQAPLPNDHVHFTTETGVTQEFLNIKQSAFVSVDAVFRGAVSKQDAADSHFGILNRQCTVRVVDGERDLGATERSLLVGSRENYVFHLAAAQGFCTLLAHYPGEGVNDV